MAEVETEVIERDPTEGMRRVAALKQVVDAANVELESAKENLKLRRAQHKKALEKMQLAIDEEAAPSLFSEGIFVTEDDLEKARHECDETDEEDDGEPSLPENGQWRGCPIADLGSKVVGAEIVKNMAEFSYPIRTLGELHNFLTAPGSQSLKDVPGISKNAAKRIADALFSFISATEQSMSK